MSTNVAEASVNRTLKVPGATLHYQVQGSGPVLLIIPGAPADSSVFEELSKKLSDSFKVVTYDPRGIARSTLDRPLNDEKLVQTNADDAHLLLASISDAAAFVFASSGGAVTGLELVRRHPEQVRALVAHEPPAAAFLPYEKANLAAQQDVYDTYRREGIGPAMGKFLAVVGLNPDQQQTGPPAEPSPETREAMTMMQRTLEVFLGHYLLATARYKPDAAALKSVGTRVEAGTGVESTGLARDGGIGLARFLGKKAVEFPGGHGGFTTHPEDFAKRLRQILLSAPPLNPVVSSG